MYGVSKVYPGQVVALDDINLRIRGGEFVFLVGPSGAGKSTFVRLVYGEERPTRGLVLVDGRNVGRLRPREIPYLRRRLGVVFQDFKLLNDRTVFENVAFALRVTGASGREIRRRVPAVLSLVGLEDRARARPLELSGGEQQRVSLARAIVTGPSAVLADEPTGNLDPDTSWDIVNLLLRINRAGTTVVMATHAKAIVDRLRMRVVAIENGRIIRDEPRGSYS
ncbi:MAG: cell division ATP-binding protein FtsE [Acetobacteraceae bacterium]|nr:cell division ATP-binding protein FtsE [Acetobacteraceae bacterium]